MLRGAVIPAPVGSIKTLFIPQFCTFNFYPPQADLLLNFLFNITAPMPSSKSVAGSESNTVIVVL